MSKTFKDGTIISNNTPLYNKSDFDSFISHTLHLATILRTRYKEDPNNQNKRILEYDVQLVSGIEAGRIILNCRAINNFGGIVNFQETVLQERTQAITENKNDLTSKPEGMDGSYVVIAFLEADYNTGIIIGTWPHPLNVSEGTGQADGIKLLGEFNGIEWNINDDGEFILTYHGGKRNTKTRTNIRSSTADTEIKIDKDGKFTITDNEDQIFKMDRVSKKITIDANEKATITLDQTNIATIETENGSTIEIDESSGIVIEDQTNNNTITLDSDGININDANNNDITLDSDGIKTEDTNGHKMTLAPGGITIEDKDGNKIVFTPTAITMMEALTSKSIIIATGSITINGQTTTMIDGINYLTHKHIGNLGFPTGTTIP